MYPLPFSSTNAPRLAEIQVSNDAFAGSNFLSNVFAFMNLNSSAIFQLTRSAL